MGLNMVLRGAPRGVKDVGLGMMSMLYAVPYRLKIRLKVKGDAVDRGLPGRRELLVDVPVPRDDARYGVVRSHRCTEGSCKLCVVVVV